MPTSVVSILCIVSIVVSLCEQGYIFLFKPQYLIAEKFWIFDRSRKSFYLKKSLTTFPKKHQLLRILIKCVGFDKDWKLFRKSLILNMLQQFSIPPKIKRCHELDVEEIYNNLKIDCPLLKGELHLSWLI